MSFDVEDGRHFRNEFPDYSDSCRDVANGELSAEVRQRVESAVEMLLSLMRKNLGSLDRRDESAYTGMAGVAHLYWFLSVRETDPSKREEWTQLCRRLVGEALHGCSGRVVTFLCGDSGPLLTALLSGTSGLSQDELVDRLLGLKKRALEQRTPDEVLYGRAGYLYALLVCRRLGVKQSAVDDVIKQVVAAMLESGCSLSAQLKGKAAPLMYMWHDSYYMGAAHGLTGIMYLLMQVPSELMPADALATLVRPTIDWLMGLRFPSGNFPSSWGRERDKLVHWCHGAPGWIYMFTRAYELFKDDRYLEQARTCGEVIWARGLLRKGYGICHGVAGNGYAFLALYRLTGEERHLYRAIKFADFCCHYGEHGCNTADRPFSLFEGLAGTIYFLKDLLEPKKSRFPAYEL